MKDPLRLAVFVTACTATLLLSRSGTFAADTPPPSKHGTEVAAIYFPSWHADDHYSSWYGEGWNEWELIEKNPQRFPGQNTVKPADD